MALATLAAALAGAADGEAAEGLNAQIARQEADAMFLREVAYTNSVCGGALVGRIGWQSFASLAEPPAPKEVVLLCDQALGALEHLCGTTQAAKARIAGSIAVLECRGGGMRGVSLDRGYLSFTATRDGEDGFSFVRDFLAAWLGADGTPR